MSICLTLGAEALHAGFFVLTSPRSVARLLDVTYSQLIYHVRKRPPGERYCQFMLRKRSGGLRTILAPNSSLKIIQQKLNQVLQSVYVRKPSVHGFVRGRSILSNACVHSGRRYVLNIDLKDFFPSINFGRVRGMFMSRPYDRNADVATILAQICCHDNQLPQGAPTSPVVSNMICAKLDSELQRIASRNRATYSRYADDITFSTTALRFPKRLGGIVEDGPGLGFTLSSDVRNTIQANGFSVNETKVRLQSIYSRQEVTGLTTNVSPNVRRRYVRQIRAMLHAARKFGLEAAEMEFRSRYDHKHRRPGSPLPVFTQVLKGKISFLAMIRGRSDAVVDRFLQQYSEIDPNFEYVAPRQGGGWPDLKRRLQVIQQHLARAKETEEFQSVGLLCREALISLAKAVSDPSKHLTLDGTKVSPTDVKRILDAFIAAKLDGPTNAAVRSDARATVTLANEMVHKTSATRKQAQLCSEATQAVIRKVAIIAGQEAALGSHAC